MRRLTAACAGLLLLSGIAATARAGDLVLADGGRAKVAIFAPARVLSFSAAG